MNRRASRGTLWSAIAAAGLVAWVAPAFAQTQQQDQAQQQDRIRQQDQTRWDQQAEQTFMLGRGTGRQLMTQQEWQEHRRAMQSMTAEEREQYRQEVHAKMQERARERGITLPDVPRGPMSGQPGGGMGPGGGGGMGPGGGMGGGPGAGPGGQKR